MMAARALGVLFDLDGTLIDSAPDLAGAANHMRTARGLAPLPLEALAADGRLGRARHGGRRLSAIGAGRARLSTELREEFCVNYEARMTEQTRARSPASAPLLEHSLRAGCRGAS